MLVCGCPFNERAVDSHASTHSGDPLSKQVHHLEKPHTHFSIMYLTSHILMWVLPIIW